MQTVSAQSGLRWIQLGWYYFASQPLALLALFFGNLFLFLLLNIIPVVGSLLIVTLTPAAAMAIASACALIARKQALIPGLLFVGYRSPALPRLMRLGMVYGAVCIGVILIIHQVSEGQFLQMMAGKLKLKPGDAIPDAIANGFFTALILYPCVILLFWFTAPLVMWQGMTPGKALFYNFFAVWRARSAFLVFAIVWFLIFIIPMIGLSLLGKLLGTHGLTTMLAMAMMMTMKVAFDCSGFASYQQIFGDPETIT